MNIFKKIFYKLKEIFVSKKKATYTDEINKIVDKVLDNTINKLTKGQ